jgi:membrane protein implicated in regulation of membrane protease activity
MDWNAAMLWWVLAGLLVAAELLSGTFYLLMIAVGAAAGAVAAHAGLGVTAQLVTAALVGGGATAAWHVARAKAPRSAPSERNRDVNLDIGQPLQVTQWQADGSARSHYRGASWSVRYAGAGTPQPGEHVIVAVHGSELSVAPAAPSR